MSLRRARILFAAGVSSSLLAGGAVAESSGATSGPVAESIDSVAPCVPAAAELSVNTMAPDGVTAPTGNWTATSVNRDPASAETAAAWQARFEQALAQMPGTPAVWVAIADPNLGYWVAAIGDAVQGETPATIDDHSRIGSVTKSFTATAVLEQVAAGSFSLDDTVARLVPQLADQFPEIADITVDQLLSMTSGLPDYANTPGAVLTQTVADPTLVWTEEELIEFALDAGVTAAPGVRGTRTRTTPSLVCFSRRQPASRSRTSSAMWLSGQGCTTRRCCRVTRTRCLSRPAMATSTTPHRSSCQGLRRLRPEPT